MKLNRSCYSLRYQSSPRPSFLPSLSVPLAACNSKPLASFPDRTLPALPAVPTLLRLSTPHQAYPSSPAVTLLTKPFPVRTCLACLDSLASTVHASSSLPFLSSPRLPYRHSPHLDSPRRSSPALPSRPDPTLPKRSSSVLACVSLPYSPDHPASLQTSSVHSPPSLPSCPILTSPDRS